jgi:hypothetical protein
MAHPDVAKDKSVVKKAVHKHEANMHPGKPKTKLKKGGMPKPPMESMMEKKMGKGMAKVMMQKKAGRGR